MIRWPILTLILLIHPALTGPSAAQSDPTALPLSCEQLSRSDFLRIVHCPDPLEDIEFATVGQAACGDSEICGTWIWLSRDDAPVTAPENHDGLTQDQIKSAYGVWTNDNREIIRITKD